MRRDRSGREPSHTEDEQLSEQLVSRSWSSVSGLAPQKSQQCDTHSEEIRCVLPVTGNRSSRPIAAHSEMPGSILALVR